MKTIILVLLAIASSCSLACSVPNEPTLAENYSKADHVVLAKIVSARLVINDTKEKKWERESVEATYEVLEAFKGNHNPPIVREMVFGPGNCMMGLLVGNMYVLFIHGAERVTGWPNGSFMLWDIQGTKVSPVLKQLQVLRANAHPGVAATPLD